jgi:hypothetical protein
MLAQIAPLAARGKPPDADPGGNPLAHPAAAFAFFVRSRENWV